MRLVQHWLWFQNVVGGGGAQKFYYVHPHFTAMETKARMKSLAQGWQEGRAEHMQP